METFCTINQSKEDDSLAEDVKCLKDISYNHGCNQYSTIETLNLVKSKLEDLKELHPVILLLKQSYQLKRNSGKYSTNSSSEKSLLIIRTEQYAKICKYNIKCQNRNCLIDICNTA
jgi:CTP:phosphocholine cytidylyltransferase-like protein